MAKTGQRLKLLWTRYKSVQKAKARQRHQKVEAWKSGLNADRILEREAKTETDNAILAAKAHYENKITIQGQPETFLDLHTTLYKIFQHHRRAEEQSTWKSR